MSKQQVSKLAEGVSVIVTQNKNPASVVFEIENKQLMNLKFVLDITGSKNLSLGQGAMEASTVVPALSTTKVGVATPGDPATEWRLIPKFRWTETDPDPSILETALSETKKIIAKELEVGKREHFDSDALTLETIKEKCASLNQKFIDLEFPPSDESIDSAASSKPKAAQWRRAPEFLGASTVLFDKGIEPNDIKQGELGDCWLLCAFAALAEFPNEVSRLFRESDHDPVQTVNSAGVYDVKFCKNGEWQRFRLDDYFPCKFGGETMYARASGPELWVMLLEKAFAKSCGHYGALRSGWAYEAMMDLTGCPTTKVSFDDERFKPDLETDPTTGKCKFFDFLLIMDAARNLITCSTPGEDKWTEGGGGVPLDGPGLVSGHAYTLIQVKKLSTGDRLVQLRNPWGDFEWNGKWSDGSSDWTPKLLAEVGQSGEAPDLHDGKFWMAYEDFIHFFNGVNVCRLFAEPATLSAPATRWIEHRENGRFTFVNHKLVVAAYEIYVPTTTKAWISIHQQDSRDIDAQPYIDMGVTILRSDQKTLVGSSGFDVDRQVQVEVELTPGTYYVVPYTSGCKFSILEHMEESAPSTQLFENGKLTHKAEIAIRELHSRYDVDLNQTLTKEEFTTLIQELTGQDVSDADFNRILARSDSIDHQITPDGLVDYFTALAQTPAGISKLKKALGAAGYDKHLILTQARRFIFSIHSTAVIKVSRSIASGELLDEAIERPVTEYGRKKEFDDGKVALYELRAGYNGVSLAVHNLHDASVELTLDCKTHNAISHTGSLRATRIIRQGEVEILHHLMPEKESPWSFGYSIEWKRLPRQREIHV